MGVRGFRTRSTGQGASGVMMEGQGKLRIFFSLGLPATMQLSRKTNCNVLILSSIHDWLISREISHALSDLKSSSHVVTFKI